MRMMDVDKLKPHPKNNYFFDDIDGEPWTAFLESIETSGVIEPIIVDGSDLTIVSGHQRVRACKKLGIKQVAVEERHYDSEDERLKQLIETNIRQRGIGNANAIKFGRCVAELERVYRIRNGSANEKGNNRIGEGTKFRDQKTQDDLAEELDMSTKQLRKYKSLTELIPELQSAVESGQITATTAMGFVKKLSPEEQKKLAESISGKDKVSSKEIDKYIADIKSRDLKIADLEFQNQQLNAVNKSLAKQANQDKKVVEIEVVPDDYEQAKKDADAARKDFQYAKKQCDEMAEKLKQSESEIQRLLDEKNDPKMQKLERQKVSAFSLSTGVADFLERFGGFTFLMEEINSLPQKERDAVNNAVKAMYDWANTMLNTSVTEVVE